MRVLWISSSESDPEDSYPPVAVLRPLPETILFQQATPELISRRLHDAVLVDGRGSPTDASALIAKLGAHTDAPFIVVLHPHQMAEFDWSTGAADMLSADAVADELAGRISRLLSPTSLRSEEVLRRGNLTINRERFEVRVGEQLLDLTFKEFELLEYLAARPGKVCSRNTLLQEVWGYEFFGGTRTVDVHIRRLRAKLGPEHHLIETVRNVGYRFAG